MLFWLLRLLDILNSILGIMKSRKEAEAAEAVAAHHAETSKTEELQAPTAESLTTLEITFDLVKKAALQSLKDSNAKDELLDLLKAHKDLFVEESRGYLKAIVSTFQDGEYNAKDYKKLLDALGSAQLVAEVLATADALAVVTTTHLAKKKLVEDLKEVASAAARKALISGLVAAVGPVAGPLVGLLTN